MAERICESFQSAARRLMDLGLVLSVPEPGGINSVYWREAENAAGKSREKPYDRSICMCWMSHRLVCIHRILWD